MIVKAAFVKDNSLDTLFLTPLRQFFTKFLAALFVRIYATRFFERADRNKGPARKVINNLGINMPR